MITCYFFCYNRIVCEDEEKVRIYHNLENARLYHKVDAQYIELTPEVRSLLKTHCILIILITPQLVSSTNSS